VSLRLSSAIGLVDYIVLVKMTFVYFNLKYFSN